MVSLLFVLFGGGYWIGQKYGRPWTGTLWGISIFVVVGIAYFLFSIFAYCYWQPMLPICKSGKCRKERDFEPSATEPEKRYYTCKCGIRYVLQRKGTYGRQFMEVLPDGTTKPYMKHSRFGRWKLYTD